VELSFENVSAPRELRDEINRIRFATIAPATCAGGKCL
jgi:hypothetical protein